MQIFEICDRREVRRRGWLVKRGKGSIKKYFLRNRSYNQKKFAGARKNKTKNNTKNHRRKN
jgi:hypothetical protein